MDVVGHKGITVELDAWPVELGFGQDACTKLTDTFLGGEDELSSKCLGNHMVGDRWVDIAGVTDLLTDRSVHLSTEAGYLPGLRQRLFRYLE